MKIGLVLSGGLAKGAVQAGFLRAFEEVVGSEHVCCVSGASIGLLNGYMFCKGQTRQLLDIWKSVHFDSVPDLVCHTFFKRYLNHVVKQVLNKDDHLHIPLYSPICYLPFLHMNYARMIGEFSPKWYSFVRGAVAFPVVSGGIRFFRGQIVIDGGTVDNVPVCPLATQEKPDVILVLHFLSKYRPRKEYLDTNIPIFDFDLSVDGKYKKSTFDFHHETIEEMLQYGYQRGKEFCEQVFSQKENVSATVNLLREKMQEEKHRRAGGKEIDSWVRRMNEVLHPFVKNGKKRILNLQLKPKRRKLRYAVKEMS